MADVLKNAKVAAAQSARLVTADTGAPTNLDDYVVWFNQRFTFARAEIRTGLDGRRFMDLIYR